MTRDGEGAGDDRRHLERARALARNGWGRVHPNPMVGCVLVRDGEVVAEGWHREFGGPHAEVRALERAGERARGATAYVSLEPCDHRGKTPPCSRALIEAGVRRVVFGAPDPGGESSGGAGTLRSAGIDVVGPVLGPSDYRRDDPAFFHWAEHGAPYVALKLAVSLDGAIAEAPGRTTAVTGPEALDEAHRLRAGFGGVLVGATTARVDDPRLTVRRGPEPRVPPTRIVLDTRARTSPDAALFQGDDPPPVLLFVAEGAPDDAVGRLRDAGAAVIRVPTGEDGLALEPVFDRLAERGIRSVLCEGGGVLAAALLGAGRVHRIYLFVAPRVLGPRGVPAFPGRLTPGILEGWAVSECRGPLGRDALLVMDPAAPDA